MSRLATPAEVLAVTEACGREVTLAGLALACAVVQVARLADSAPDELRDWREDQDSWEVR